MKRKKEEQIIQKALSILERRVMASECLSEPKLVEKYLQVLLADKEHEIFVVVFLDAQHRVICCDEMFRGSLTQTSVYPREIVKASLAVNAAGVIFAHNHPSGHPDPSHTDEQLTDQLKRALSYVDVKVLDHFVVTNAGAVSFAERGLL